MHLRNSLQMRVSDGIKVRKTIQVNAYSKRKEKRIHLRFWIISCFLSLQYLNDWNIINHTLLMDRRCIGKTKQNNKKSFSQLKSHIDLSSLSFFLYNSYHCQPWSMLCNVSLHWEIHTRTVKGKQKRPFMDYQRQQKISK